MSPEGFLHAGDRGGHGSIITMRYLTTARHVNRIVRILQMPHRSGVTVVVVIGVMARRTEEVTSGETSRGIW